MLFRAVARLVIGRKLGNISLVVKEAKHQFIIVRRGSSRGTGFSSTGTKMGKQPTLNFLQRFNPTLNKFEWTEQPEEYDFYQEIARSAYADMLHDFDRNIKYEKALAWTIKKVHDEGKEAVVLDIGTGTGLLSMMAVRHGADRVYACEAFEPMALCAAQVIERNNCSSKIKLIPKRSTDLEVGPGKDLDTRANILVTEVFDTELIGEGAIETFNHAHDRLLEADCHVIPHSAEIFAMAVECPAVNSWNVLTSVNLPTGDTIHFPKPIAECSGVPSVHDVQLSQIKEDKFKRLSSPELVFEFNYNEHSKRTPSYRSSVVNFTSTDSGKCNAIFTWWVLRMDSEGQIVVTMQPEWWKSSPSGSMPTWKDHWMQCVYYLPEQRQITKGEGLIFEAFHDEFSLWYKIKPENGHKSVLNQEHEVLERPICDCGVHTTLSRLRMGMLNDKNLNDKYVSALQKVIIPGESVILCLSESSLLPLIGATLGAKKVFVVEEHCHSARVMNEFIQFNQLQDKVTVINKKHEAVTSNDLQNLQINIVVGDPYFHSSILPWNNLYFWYAKEALNWSYVKDVKIIPSKAYLTGIAVSFKDLHHIKAPVRKLRGFESYENSSDFGYDLQDFDNLVLRASDLTDHRIDAQPLWEYEGSSTSREFKVATFDLSGDTLDVTHSAIEYEKFRSPTNGIVLWMDWQLDENTLISNGPISKPEVNDSKSSLLEWDMNSKQGIFFTHGDDVRDTSNIGVKFNVETGDVEMCIVKNENKVL